MFQFNQIIALVILTIMLSLGVISFSENGSIPLFSSPELESPSNWIPEEAIKVYDDRVLFNVLNPTWAKFTNTNSMDPFLDEDSNAIEILPSDPDSIQVGDVISYQTSSGVIIHRVIGKGHDAMGLYYTVKGDNATFSDP
jgi:hypothetical protein